MVRGAGVSFIFLALLAAPLALAQQGASSHQIIEVRIADAITDKDTGKPVVGPLSGRLVISAVAVPADVKVASLIPQPGAPPSQPQQERMSAISRLSSQLRDPATALIASMEVEGAKPGDILTLDADRVAYPMPFSALPPGTYYATAMLDRDRDLSYTGYPSGGDLMSRPIVFTLPGRPSFTLERTYGATTPWPGLDNMPAGRAPNPNTVELRAHTRDLDFVSPSLSSFHSKETHIRGWVLLPPGYDESKDTFPVVYSFAGFGARLNDLSTIPLTEVHHPMYGRYLQSETSTPPMIWVFLDHSWPGGTHEFADSANAGPWGQALTGELIPWIEKQYRMDGKPSGRLLTGHSSGGWAALWLQVKYPELFGGAWPTAPDPVDFRDFTNTDIYAPNANVFYAADGSLKPLARERGGKTTSFKTYSDFEFARGPVGGQLASFEWVFSPKGADGKPLPLFDRKTGAVDPKVAQYWGDHYDIGRYVSGNWDKLKPELDGKIHFTVGTADTFYLDQPARLFKQTLDALGAKSEFVFVPGRQHGDLFVAERNAVAMYRVARPDSNWKPQPIPRPAPLRPRAPSGSAPPPG